MWIYATQQPVDVKNFENLKKQLGLFKDEGIIALWWKEGKCRYEL